MAPHPEPLFLSVSPGPLGQRFALYHAPRQNPTRGLIVYVHPFAEEMNKSRRMAALQSRAFADAGFAVLQIDLLGCGDSAGDFGDATWGAWVDDVLFACRWLRERRADDAVAPLWLWGLRVGCLLATEAVDRLPEACSLLFWQPFISGRLALQQFLRLKAAGEMLSGSAKGVTDSLRAQLASGGSVEVGGYVLDPSLASGLEQCQLESHLPTGPVLWIESCAAGDDAAMLPASQRVLRSWRQSGLAVAEHAVTGPPFWQTTEIEDSPALLAVTLTAILGASKVAGEPCAPHSGPSWAHVPLDA